jgi:hypothetical protein
MELVMWDCFIQGREVTAELLWYSDSDLAGDLDSTKSTCCYFWGEVQFAGSQKNRG